MNTILWLALIIFIGLPVAGGVYLIIFDFDMAIYGRQSKVKTVIALVASIALFISCSVDAKTGIFTSVKHFVTLACKFVGATALLTNWIIATISDAIRAHWNKRITNALNNSLGEELRRILPPDSIYYSVETFYERILESHLAIFYIVNGTKKVITFKSLGYEDFPAEYADAVCRWIQNNIVQDKNAYKIEDICSKYEELSSAGTSDYIETTRTSSGYESRYVTGDSATYTERTSINGCKLIHNSYASTKQVKRLKRW